MSPESYRNATILGIRMKFSNLEKFENKDWRKNLKFICLSNSIIGFRKLAVITEFLEPF
jgi:hypothetical protein